MDLFREKADDWDNRPLPVQISQGVCAAIEASVTLDPTLRVMDFGAGTGLICGRLAPKVGHVVAVDISEAMLEKLAAKPELASNVSIHCRDILHDPLDDKVDLIVSAMAMHHVEDTEALLRSWSTHLVPGGRIAVADLDAEDGTFHPPGIEGVFHHGFDRRELTSTLAAAGFVDVAFHTAVEVDREGRRYPIFLLTARNG